MNYSNLDLSILKSIIVNKKHALDFINDCDPKLFSTDIWVFANIVYNYIKNYKELPTLRTLTDGLQKGGNEQLVNTISKFWKELEDFKYDESEYVYDLKKLKKRFAEKQLLQLKESVSKLDPEKVDINKHVIELQKTVQNIKSLDQKRAYNRKTLKGAIDEFKEEYKAKQQNPDHDQGISTGYSFLDHATDGLRPGELLLVGGESGAGKSMLLMNMALQMWMQKNTINTESDFSEGNDVLYFSLEMPFKPCFNRVLSRLSTAPSKKIRSAQLNAEDIGKLKKTIKFIKNYQHQFEIIDIPRGATMESLELLYEDAKLHFNPKVIVIDYLGLMEYEDTNMDDWLKLGKIAEKIHEFARVHNVIVLSAVQLNRAKGGKDAEEKIGLHRIGRSALIMQNANIAVQIETRASEKNYPDMFYHLIKNRDGNLGKGRIIKNLSCGSLIDDPIKIDDDYDVLNPDDISEKAELFDM